MANADLSSCTDTSTSTPEDSDLMVTALDPAASREQVDKAPTDSECEAIEPYIEDTLGVSASLAGPHAQTALLVIKGPAPKGFIPFAASFLNHLLNEIGMHFSSKLGDSETLVMTIDDPRILSSDEDEDPFIPGQIDEIAVEDFLVLFTNTLDEMANDEMANDDDF